MAIPVGNYSLIQQMIEGNRVTDLQWGTSNAKYAVLRFASYHITQGNSPFCIAIRNNPITHSLVFLQNTHATSNKWKEHSLVIPPCTVGTWGEDNATSLNLLFTIACGATTQTANTGIWQEGNFFATSAVDNYPSTFSSMFMFAEIGLYADPNMTGVAPVFQQPHYEDDLMDCQRYWYKAHGLRGGAYSTTVARFLTGTHPNVMRAAPALALVGTALRSYDGTGVPPVTSITATGNNTQNVSTYVNVASGLLTQPRRAGILIDSLATSEANYIATSARM